MQITENERILLCGFDRNKAIRAEFDDVQCLTAHGLLEFHHEDSGSWYWVLSREGELLKEKFKNESEQKAEDKRQQSIQNKLHIASILVPLISFFLGLIVEHFIGIARILFSVFH